MNFFRRKSSRIQGKENSELHSLLNSLEAKVTSHQSGASSLNSEEVYAVRLQLFELEHSGDSTVINRVVRLSQELESLTASTRDSGTQKKRRKVLAENSTETCSFRGFDANLLTNQNFVTLPSAEVSRPTSTIIADTEVFESFENRHAHLLSPDIFEGCQAAGPNRDAAQMDTSKGCQAASPDRDAPQMYTSKGCQTASPDRDVLRTDTSVSDVEAKADDVEVRSGFVSEFQHRRITERLERLDREFELEEFDRVTQKLNEMIDVLKTNWKAISNYAEPSQPTPVQRIIPAFYTADQRGELEAKLARETAIKRDDNELLKLQYMMLDCAEEFTEDEEDGTDTPDWKAIYGALDKDFCNDVL